MKQKLAKEQEVCTQTEDVFFHSGLTQNKTDNLELQSAKDLNNVQKMEMPPVQTCDVAKLEDLKSPDALGPCCGSIKNLCGLNKEEFLSPPTIAPQLDISNKGPAITAPVQSIGIEGRKTTDVKVLKSESSGKLMSPSVPELSAGVRGTPFSSVDSGMDLLSNSSSAECSIISESSVDSLAALARETLKIVGATNQQVLQNANLSGASFDQNMGNGSRENAVMSNSEKDKLPLSQKQNIDGMSPFKKETEVGVDQGKNSPTSSSETLEKKSDRQSFGENAKGIPFIDATPRVISPSEPNVFGDIPKAHIDGPAMSPVLQVVHPADAQLEVSGLLENFGSLSLDSDDKENASPQGNEFPANDQQC